MEKRPTEAIVVVTKKVAADMGLAEGSPVSLGGEGFRVRTIQTREPCEETLQVSLMDRTPDASAPEFPDVCFSVQFPEPGRPPQAFDPSASGFAPYRPFGL